MLDAQPDEYSNTGVDPVGFRVQFHEPGELPQVFKLGHLVTPGFAYSMALTRHKARLDTMQVFLLTLCKSVKSSDRTSFSL